MATIFLDEFTGSGTLEGHAPDTPYGSLTWTEEGVNLSGGYAVSANNANTFDYGSAQYGNNSTNYGNAADFELTFTFKTGPSVTPSEDGHFGFSLVFSVCGVDIAVAARSLPSADGWELVHTSVSTAIEVEPDTEYTGVLTSTNGAQSLAMFGETIDRNVSYFTEDGFQSIYMVIGSTCGIGSILVGDGEAPPEDGDADGLGEGVGEALASLGGYSNPTGAGVAASWANTQVVANTNPMATGRGASKLDAPLFNDAVAAGVGASTVDTVGASDLFSAGVGKSFATPGASTVRDAVAAGVGQSFAQTAPMADAVASGVGQSMASPGAAVLEDALAEGIGESMDAVGANMHGVQAVASGIGASTINSQVTANANPVAAGAAQSFALFDILYQAWVMNTSTTAMSRYAGLPLRSAAMIGERVVALGDGGFFELSGTRDNGVALDARMRTGLTQLGTDKVKHLDDVVLGFASTSPVRVSVMATGRKPGAWSYQSPARAAPAPAGTRVKLGRGLESKYFRFEIGNTAGAPLSIDYANLLSNEFKTRRF